MSCKLRKKKNLIQNYSGRQ